MFAEEAHAPVEMTWLVYQQIITAYAHPDPGEGKTLLAWVIDGLRSGSRPGSTSWPPSGGPCSGVVTTCWSTSATAHPTGPTEAVNGRLGALRRNVLGDAT